MGKRKSYNPFKMWGSYVGVLPGLIMVILFALGAGRVGSAGGDVSLVGLGIMIWGVIAISGFLVGWGIHSLVRKLK